jgi:hypothetical protein
MESNVATEARGGRGSLIHDGSASRYFGSQRGSTVRSQDGI